MDIQPLDIVYNLINIGIFYILLRILLYKPVSSFMKKRSDGIKETLENAAFQKAAAEQMMADYEQKLSGAKADAENFLQDERQKASSAAAEILAKAETESSRMIVYARDRAEREYAENIARLEQQIADMAVSLAGEILQREVSVEDNERVIDAFFNKAV